MSLVDAGYGSYDANFACCGGCSSFKRADGNAKLTTGARVFIWDVKLKIAPAPVCLLAFPYDPGLSEQVGDRRVRSGRLVGTSYPIDHDYDSRCCEQRGQCLALDEDASGKCRCVNRWGFTGDHCEFSIYETAVVNNSKHFPVSTNLSAVETRLPDLRHYLVTFDHASAIRASMHASSTSTTDSLLGVFESDSYRQFGWSMAAYFAALAAALSLLFLAQVCWSVCCFACGCRKHDPTKQAKIYSKLTKIVWGSLACFFVCAGAVASALAFFTLHSSVIPVSEAVGVQLHDTLVSDMAQFHHALLAPLNQLLALEDSPAGLRSLTQLQAAAVESMALHTFLDNQTFAHDRIREPVFAILDELQPFTSLFPTVSDNATNCSSLSISPNVAIRMTIGASTGCFRCKACSTMLDLVAASSDLWRRNPFQVQMDLLIAQRQLQAFGATRATLAPAITQFRDQVSASCTAFSESATRVATEYERLRAEVHGVVFIGSLSLIGLSGLATALGLAGFSHGVASNKRHVARSACFVAEVACIVAIVLAGVLYTTALMAHDGIVALQVFNESSSAYFVSDQVARDVERVLFDVNLVNASGYEDTFAFADTLRVPPHPTPANDAPPRFNVSSLYFSVFTDLFALAQVAAQSDTAIAELFGWDDAFVATQRSLLVAVAFGNASVPSPYNQTLHQDLLNGTTARLMDPDNDALFVTSSDVAEIRRVFNESWRGVDDRGAHQNTLIIEQWFFVAQLHQQRLRLVAYTARIASIINSIRPLLVSLVEKTSAMEAAEFSLKASVEFVTDAIRASKIHDCSYNRNCGWLRDSVNELFALFQDIVTNAEQAAVLCAISAASSLVGLVLLSCFAGRLRRKTVKVYVGS